MFQLSHSTHLAVTSYAHLSVGLILNGLWTEHGDLGRAFAYWCLNNTDWDGKSTIQISV